VICGVDMIYGFSGEYIAQANKLIAERTKVGGIVLTVGSDIGTNMPDNFKLIYDQIMGARVYLREY